MRFIYLLLFLSPLPFASARPIWEYVWCIFIGMVGLIHAFRWGLQNEVRKSKVVYLPVAAIFFAIIWGVLQVLLGWSVAPERTISATLYLLSHLVWFFLVLKSFKKSTDIPKFVLMTGLIVSTYCLYGLLVYFSGNDTVLWFEKWASYGALTSTFVNRNNFAAYTGMGLQCMTAFALWTYHQSPKANRPFSATMTEFLNKGPTKAGIFFLSLIIVIVCLFLTASRAGIMSSIIATLCLVSVAIFRFINSPSLSKDNLKNTGAYLVVFFVALLFIVFGVSGDVFEERILGISYDGDARLVIYPLMVDAIIEAPITGSGLGTFSDTFAQYRAPDLPFTIRKGHSDILEIYMTGGAVVGTVISISFLIMTVYFLRSALMKPRSNILLLLFFTLSFQIGLHSIVDFSLQIPAISYLFTALWAAGGYLVSKQ